MFIEGFLLNAPVLFILAIYIFSFSIILKSSKLFFTQVLLSIFIIITGNIPIIHVALELFQVILAIFVLYKLYQALEYNYQLILEKTHQVPRKITNNGYNGTTKTFI